MLPTLQAPPSLRPAQMAVELRDAFGSLLVDLRLELAWLDQRLAEQAASSGDAVHTLRMEMRMRCDGMAEQIDRAVHRLERMAGEQGGA
ncbi:hypothetical protein GN316_10705 [Xylophilus sp. Kf1]|nr:hypothetical protein [Xylophilus sp. Kf1]